MSFDGRALSNISVLAAIVESGSFARAADALGLSPSGVSRAVGRLELSIGVRLLDRTTRSVTLTDEGRQLYEEIGPLLTGIGDAVNLAAGASAAVRGALACERRCIFSRRMLAPHIAKFLDRYPELSLELATREQLGDLVADGFDVAIRFGQPPSSSLIARKLLETHTMTVAAPVYIRKHGRPETPAGLVNHACIQMRNPVTGQPLEWEYKSGRKAIPVKTSGRLLVTEAGTMLGACLAGGGIARIKAGGVRDLVDKDRLVELLPDYVGETFPLYALYPSRHLPVAKVRAFIDFVIEILDGDAA
ncbi:LysR family transcriptional regulator [Caballeronia sp. SEWSISQ10-4 2]|uniref:LysR family transcriptional regulator n=1 Tax=Caballeronia sp. SEWSISQ10-4 2 TaxID=2937438 RepID=UPI00264D586F|nr:LysR family transcriptional regulator [Caballeronia sp. SEWSISQ10-4 2]MDN7180486.1 LysR family transcriptional regulator [Caballeronia sp. SEWSISQ10-4 2]